MPKRFFVNKFSDYHSRFGDVYTSINKEHMKQKCLQIKNLCLSKFWKKAENCDGGVYVGLAGLSYALWYVSTKSVFENERIQLLNDAKILSDFHLTYAEKSRENDRGAFLLGRGGLYAVAALVSSSIGDKENSDRFIKKYADASKIVTPIDYVPFGGDELFVGRAGYLCGVLNLRKKLDTKVVDDEIVQRLLRVLYESGHKYSRTHCSSSPLMYSYYGTEYLGAAHGLCSILQMMISFPDCIQSTSEIEQAVKNSVDWMMTIQQINGNTPSTTEGQDEEDLVHWCHGAPGVVYMYIRAYHHWQDDKYLQAALKCGEVVWELGLLKKGPGICHGVSGNAYVFLMLFRLTNDQKYLYRALKFVEFMETDEFSKGSRTPDSPYSLFEGLAGAICLYADLADDAKQAEFPLIPVFF